jgi:hypothetical protein
MCINEEYLKLKIECVKLDIEMKKGEIENTKQYLRPCRKTFTKILTDGEGLYYCVPTSIETLNDFNSTIFGKGSTPEQACENFDTVWMKGIV